MTDVHVTLKLAKSSNNYDYTDLKDYDEIQPQQSDAIGAKYTFGVPPIAKAGDTITIRWSKNLNTYGFGNEKFNSNIMTADGKNILAEPAANKSMTDNQFIFTLTDYVKDHNNIKGELLVPLFVDPKEVKNDSLTPISASLGNTSDKHYIVVHYNEYAHSYPSSVGSIITEDASNKEVSSVIYANPEGDMADGGHVDVENIDGSNIKLDRNSLRSFKVYRVSPSIELPQSYDFDPHDFDTDDNVVEDVTSLANYSFSKNVDNEPVMSIKLPASEYDSSKYVTEFTTKYESSDSKILGLRSKYWDGNDGTLTSSEFAFTEYSPESDVSGDNKPVDPSTTVNPDPKDPGKDVQVPYAQEVAGTVTYIDDTTGNTLSTYDIPKGTVGSKINYSTTETTNNYEKQGYVLVSNNYPTDAVYKVSGNDYQVHLVEGVQPITPDTPPTDVPTGTPENAQPSALKKDVSLTVKYVNSDGSQFTGKVPANASQSLHFSGEAYVSKVTGKLVNAKQDAKGQWIVDSSNKATPEITWTPKSSSFSEVVSPVEAGYYLKNISSHEAGNNVEAISGITHTSDNVEVTVTYAPLGKMIPVDPNGHQIPGQNHPQFPNNPNDPSKGNPGDKPDVPGWKPVDPSTTVNPDPKDPGKDVQVPYAQEVAGTVTYIDDTTGNTLSTYDIPKGTVGSKINYSTTETTNNYEKQGYVLVSNNYPTDAVYKVSGNDYQVHLVEGVQPITPDTPPTDVPTGTPENAQPSALKKDVSLTVKYVNSDGSQFTGRFQQTQVKAYTLVERHT